MTTRATLFLVPALLLAACATDDDSGVGASDEAAEEVAAAPSTPADTAGPDTTPNTTVPETTVPETTVPETTVPPTTAAPTTAPADDDAAGIAGDPDSPWCAAAREVEAATRDLESDDFDFTNPEEVELLFGVVVDRLEAAAQVAPPEISDAVGTTLEGFQQLDDAFAAADYDVLVADLSIMSEIDAEMDAAGDRITTYNEEVCGLTADSDLGERDDAASEDAGAEEDDTDSDFDPTLGSIRDQTIAELVEAGFTESEAACVFDAIDFDDPGLGEDVSVIIEVFQQCEIDLDRLAQLGGG